MRTPIRTRLASLFAALTLAATGALAFAPETALMAAVSREAASFNNGTATVTYTFDDTTLLVSNIHLHNGGGSGTLYVEMYSLNGQTLIDSRSLRVSEGQDKDWDVSASNRHMVLVTGKDGTQAPQLPVRLVFSWSSVTN